MSHTHLAAFNAKRARKATWAPGAIRNDLFRKGYSIGKAPSTPF